MLHKYKTVIVSWMLLVLSPSFGIGAPRNANSPPLEPYQESASTNQLSLVGESTLGLEMSRAVPEGMRLVVEHASLSIETNDPDLEAHCVIFGGVADNRFGRVTPSHALLLGPRFRMNDLSGNGRNYGRSASQQISLYIDSGLAAEIGCFFSRAITGNDPIFMTGSVTGYLIRE